MDLCYLSKVWLVLNVFICSIYLYHPILKDHKINDQKLADFLCIMFSSLLPKPRHARYDLSRRINISKPYTHQVSSQLVKLPDYNTNPDIIPNPAASETTISHIFVNPDGKLDYNKTIAASNAHSKKVQSSFEDTIPLKTKYPNLKHHFPRYTLETCPDDSLKECLEDTRSVINKIIEAKTGVNEGNKKDEVTFIKYTSNNILDNSENNDDDDNDYERGRERIIQIRNYQEDPMLPPKFKLRKNRHKNPSPPPPLLKSSNSEQISKLTKEDQAKWQIPSAISNWKNNQGFTISLDKRMVAANGGSEPTSTDVNVEKFGELSQALENADREAREEIKIRNEIQKQLAIKEQHEKENKLKELAEIARSKKINSSGKRSMNDYEDVSKKRKY